MDNGGRFSLFRGRDLPQTSNLETATKPPTPWLEPGISGAHASISTTLSIYTHVVDASHRKAVEEVDERLFSEMDSAKLRRRFALRSRASLHLEILALRHQLTVVTRARRPRLRLMSTNRILWA